MTPGVRLAQTFCPWGNLFCGCPHGGVCKASYPENWPSSRSAHIASLRRMACVLTGRLPVTVHHCRGGSMSETPFGNFGAGRKQSDALCVPLHADWHIGQHGIDAQIGSGIKTWEARWERQTELLMVTSSRLGFNLWALAWHWATAKERSLIWRRFSPEQSARLESLSVD